MFCAKWALFSNPVTILLAGFQLDSYRDIIVALADTQILSNTNKKYSSDSEPKIHLNTTKSVLGRVHNCVDE